MTPEKRQDEADQITVDDLKQKAARIGDLAQTEFRRQTEEELTRNIAIVAVAVGLAVGLAYFMGTRRAPVCPPPEPPYPPY